MALGQEDIEFIKANLGDWLAEQSLGKPPAVYEVELRERMIRLEEQGNETRQAIIALGKRTGDLEERMIRVEEELKHQRELMLKGFEQMEKRFEQVDKRFEQVDKRFEQVDKRFEQVDKRFESMQSQMDKRFEQVDKRFEAMTRRIDRFMLWSFTTTVAVGSTVIGVLKFWPVS